MSLLMHFSGLDKCFDSTVRLHTKINFKLYVIKNYLKNDF